MAFILSRSGSNAHLGCTSYGLSLYDILAISKQQL